MNKIWIILIGLCMVLQPCRAQWVDPGDSPDLGWNVAEVGGATYKSLSAAFAAVTSSNPTVKLLIGVTLDLASPLAINENTTLDLNRLPLVCASGTEWEIAAGKTLSLSGGTLSGSLRLSGDGRLFAGTSVDMAGTGVLTGTPSAGVYRILITLPDDSGTLSDVYYGKTRATYWAREGNLLCCWLPQSVAALAVSFRYILTGNTTPAKYATAPLIVMQHAVNAVVSEEAKDEIIGDVAAVGQTGYPTLETAFRAVPAKGDTVRLLGNVTLSKEIASSGEAVLDLDSWNLTASAGAALHPASGASLLIRNGYLSGFLTVGDAVTADRSVLLNVIKLRKSIPQNKKAIGNIKERITLKSLHNIVIHDTTNGRFKYKNNN